ncbi:MAG: AAA family ATPase, partial [Planctomycetota bacterium]
MSTTPPGPDSPPLGASDTIEFACSACGRMLKVPSQAIGRQAKCPQCAMVQIVPASGNHSPTASQSIDSYGATSTPASSPPATTAVSVAPPVNPGVSRPAVNPTASPFPVAAPVRPTQPAAFSLRESLSGGHEGRETPTKQLFDRVTDEIAKVYVGQDELVLGALVALFSSGHVLIESVPGLGKTLFVRTLGKVLGCKFGRIQFTADLMPSDITGAPIFDMKNQDFRFRPGPVFTQFLLADEINRSPAKTHAALLEIMQEYRVTIDGQAHTLERPFLVLATQNPIESEGTYNLPEAQLDRFMFKLFADYPQEQEEADILRLHSQQVDINKRLEEEIQTITSPAEIMRITRENGQIRIDDKLVDYINKMVRLTRQWPQFHMGASPRAGLALMQGARTLAAFNGRDYAVPDDVVQIVIPALRHRV